MSENRHFSVCVYGGSSPTVDPSYLEQANLLGRLCGEMGIEVVSGGGSCGMMGALIDGCRSAGGHATGVLPEFMVEKGWNHPDLSEMVTTPDMHSRKRRMVRDAAWAVVLPGGIGTFDELCEIITWRQLGLFGGEVIIANINGYYDPFFALLAKADSSGFMRTAAACGKSLYTVASDAAEVARIMKEKIG